MKYAEHIDPTQEREKTFEGRVEEIARRAREIMQREKKGAQQATFAATQEKLRTGEIEVEDFDPHFQAAKKEVIPRPRNITRERTEETQEPKPRFGIERGIPNGDRD